MSADTTAVKVESSTENVDAPNQENHPNNPQQHFKSDGYRGRGGGGPRFGQRRPHNQQHNENDDRRPRFQRGGGPNQMGGPGDHRNIAERIMHDKLNELCGPSFELPLLENKEKKFSGRSRLYIGNIPNEVNDDELTDMFKKFGEVAELFVNRDKNFGFIKLDYHFNAEKAKNELNGTILKGRNLKIRYSPGSTTIKVKNLDEFVTNELLHAGFSIFGEIERCVVIADERGKSIGEGIVEFARKNSAQFALRKCSEHCFFLTANLRPVLVEQYEAVDDSDGYSEKVVPKKNPEYFKQRNMGPRFASPDSFEEEYGLHWKQLNELYQQKLLALKKENEIEQEKLVAQMEFARYEHETEMLRKQLRAREMDMDRQKREWEMREQQAEESRRRTEEQMRRHEEELQSRILHQEEEMRRRQQENSLFMQAQQLDNMLDHQEQAYEQRGDATTDTPAADNPDPKTFLKSYDNRFEGRNMGQRGGGHMGGGDRGGAGGGGGGRGSWGNDRDFPNKRRRY